MEMEFYTKQQVRDRLYAAAKSRALATGKDFNLDKDDVVIPHICPILRIELVHAKGMGRQNNAASIDRIDNSRGYVKGNVQVISFLANRMKQDATVAQLKRFGEWTQTL